MLLVRSQLTLVCGDPAGEGAGLIRGGRGGWMGVRCPSVVGRADPPWSRERKETLCS